MASKFLLDTTIAYIIDVYDVSRGKAEWAINSCHTLDLDDIDEWIEKNTNW